MALCSCPPEVYLLLEYHGPHTLYSNTQKRWLRAGQWEESKLIVCSVGASPVILFPPVGTRLLP
jgi:hypothetical protein